MDLNHTYTEYSMVFNDEQRNKYDFLVEYCTINGEHLEEKDYFSDIDLSDREFGYVKELMGIVARGDFELLIIKFFEGDEYKDMMQADAWKVILTIRYLTNRIFTLIQIENDMLSSQFPNEYSLQMETIDFSMFTNEFCQIDSLAKGDILRYEEIKKIKYSDAFVKLLYDFKNSELEKAIMKSRKAK